MNSMVDLSSSFFVNVYQRVQETSQLVDGCEIRITTVFQGMFTIYPIRISLAHRRNTIGENFNRGSEKLNGEEMSGYLTGSGYFCGWKIWKIFLPRRTSAKKLSLEETLFEQNTYPLVNVNKKLWEITMLLMGKLTINCHFQ